MAIPSWASTPNGRSMARPSFAFPVQAIARMFIRMLDRWTYPDLGDSALRVAADAIRRAPRLRSPRSSSIGWWDRMESRPVPWLALRPATASPAYGPWRLSPRKPMVFLGDETAAPPAIRFRRNVPAIAVPRTFADIPQPRASDDIARGAPSRASSTMWCRFTRRSSSPAYGLHDSCSARNATVHDAPSGISWRVTALRTAGAAHRAREIDPGRLRALVPGKDRDPGRPRRDARSAHRWPRWRRGRRKQPNPRPPSSSICFTR